MTAELFPLPEFVDAHGQAFRYPDGWTPDNSGRCRSCAAPVLWCITPAGRRAPVDPDGTSHFATCPEATQWRKPR